MPRPCVVREKRCSSVINDILDFSKIEAGKMTIESLAFDLRLVMEEVNEMLAPKAQEKHIDLILEYPPALPRHLRRRCGKNPPGW